MEESNIKERLIQEFQNGNIIDSGYRSIHGRYYVEIMDCHFKVDKGYIFENIPAYEGMEVENWYMENYYPLIKPQLNQMLQQLNDNIWSRRAILTYNNPDDITVCTNYTNCLIRADGPNNILNYFVHMRANDAVEYRTDALWHRYVIEEFIIPNLKWNIDKFIVHWNADTFHWYVN